MIVLNKYKELSGAVCTALLITIAGCAQNQKLPDESATPVAAAEEAKAEKTASVPVAPGEEHVPDYLVQNPVPIVFEKMSVKLRDNDKQMLSQLKARAQKARALTITGYCDRKQVGNAKDAALARAQSVREELLRLGVKAKAVKIKYVTDVANKHAVEIAML